MRINGDITRIVARSPAMRGVLEQCRLYARYDLPVVFVGPVGSGKTSLAEELWRSMRLRGQFVCVSAGEFQDQLSRDSLFGHAHGAFTDATATRGGLVSEASGGALFVDDLALLPADVQSAILRVLESRTYRRLGDTTEQRATCRMLFASTEEPRELVTQGKLLRDLESRLGEFIIRVPALSERPESIVPLTQAFAEAFRRKHGESSEVCLAKSARWALIRHGWPGNLRELENVAHHGVVHAGARDGVVTMEAAHLPERFRGETPRAKLSAPLVRVAVEEAGGNQSEAATRLGYHRNTLRPYLRSAG